MHRYIQLFIATINGPFVAIAITYFNALICIYWLVYNEIRDWLIDWPKWNPEQSIIITKGQNTEKVDVPYALK